MQTIEYILHEDKLLYRHFSISGGDGEPIASGYVGIDNEELRQVYNDNPELALQDARIDAVLNPEPAPEPHQPSNAEVMQAISDLQADLIIAGVI